MAFETGALRPLIGYTDWEFYRTIILGGPADYHGVWYRYLKVLNWGFADLAPYCFYLINLLIWPITLANLQVFLIRRYGYVVFLGTVNPFIYLLLSGIFKEAVLFYFLSIYLRSRYFSDIFTMTRNFVQRMMSMRDLRLSLDFLAIMVVVIVILSIRPNIYLVIFSACSFGLFYFSMGLSLGVSAWLGFIPFSLFEDSFLEISRLGLNDIPIELINDISRLIYLPYNILQYLIFGYYSNSIPLALVWIISIASLLRFYTLQRVLNLPTFFQLFLSSVFFYCFFVPSVGTAARMFSFSLLLVFFAAKGHSKSPTKPR